MLSVRRLYTIVLVASAGGFAWLAYTFYSRPAARFGVCLIKEATGVACPSCGTTRAIESLFRGRLIESFLINPFGLIVGTAMLVFPLWVLLDILAGKHSFYDFYFRTEEVLRKKTVAIPLVILVLVNWIWNIYKGL